MLAPDQRTLMLDVMRPPPGYAFDRGVGTTFTLNLMTLLVAPISLALHDASSAEEALGDPVLLLDAIRYYAGRLTLFAQAGYISIPKQANHLYRFLEEMVVEVNAPNGGLFHPKIWLLRYTAENAAPIYRFLCLSRNVGFSQSWDIVLRLDGGLMDRKVGYSRNHPLADFIQSLPEFAPRRLNRRIREDIELLREEVRRVDFQVPQPFQQDSLEFIPLGHRSHRRLRTDFRKLRSMVVSPFLSEQILVDASSSGDRHVLFSEAESLRSISDEALSGFSDIYVFNDVSVNLPVDDEALSERTAEGEANGAGDPARLHAKLFIFEEGYDARWWIGSANATWPALSGDNVEFLVGLAGRKSRVGIDKVLGGEEDKFSLRAMLAEYEPEVPQKIKPDLAQVERLLEAVRRFIAALDLKLEVVSADEESYDVEVTVKSRARERPEGEFKVELWPLTLRETKRMELTISKGAKGALFEDLSLLQLTTFIAFQVEARVGRTKRKIRFVMNLPAVGLPAMRDDHILSAILSDQSQFLRYLRYLLAEELGWLTGGNVGLYGAWGEDGHWIEDFDDQIPLLEDVVRAFSRSPEKIDQVTELVTRLQATPEGKKVLPDGFENLWDALREARGRET